MDYWFDGRARDVGPKYQKKVSTFQTQATIRPLARGMDTVVSLTMIVDTDSSTWTVHLCGSSPPTPLLLPSFSILLSSSCGLALI
ncbi:hypothetical protein CCACVL1_10998 [Corchorus capsularis]|uniref:Uncharacterized protein n=1 Tax=Corchorus capsularis TaxID=210143 RepID=A0A1R3INH0_COCAP|nr:hypothetical protein CCACVL1_10998 [Corchorus capsularis]